MKEWIEKVQAVHKQVQALHEQSAALVAEAEKLKLNGTAFLQMVKGGLQTARDNFGFHLEAVNRKDEAAVVAPVAAEGKAES